MIKKILLIISIGLQLPACSLDVKKANAPTNPPKVEKNNFVASQIQGQYEQNGAPKMFLWPVQKLDEEAGKYVDLSFAEKAVARQKISAYSDDAILYEQEMNDVQSKLDTKYATLTVDLETEYKAQSCFSLCDTDDIFCDPTDSTVLFQDSWKVTEDEVELAAIAQCQTNEADRTEIDDQKSIEVAETVRPLQIKAGTAAQAFLNEVGDRNFFGDLAKFRFNFGELLCSAATQSCVKTKNYVETQFVYIEYGDLDISNYYDNKSSLQVTEMDLDSVDGFLEFKMPAVDLEDDNKVYGEFTFDLELAVSGASVAVTGDIRLRNYKDNSERVGRFSSKGLMESVQD